MFVGEQLSDPSDARLTLAAQLGVEHVALHAAPRDSGVALAGGRWDVAALVRLKARLGDFGISLDVLGVDVERLWSELLAGGGAPHAGARAADATLERIAQNIRAAAEAGVPCLKYRIQPLGVLRTGRVPGRGGAAYSAFRYADWDDPSPTELGRVGEQRMWDAIAYTLEWLVPVAEECRVRLACHPQDAPLPPEGVRGMPHVLSSVAALERFLAICPSPCHGLNFCQGTVAEMSRDPKTEVLDAIRRFGSAGKIFMVHFRNIRGGFGDFVEVYPDNGDVDMLAAARAYHDVGYGGMLCPDHVPRSEADPGGERQFAFCLGYTKAAIQAAEARRDPAG